MPRRLLLILFFMPLLTCFSCQDDHKETVTQEEIMSGGEHFTTFDFGENAFGEQGDALTREESRAFVVGNSFFRSNWVIAPASVQSLDGVGPLQNAISCGACHFKDGRAAPFDEFSVRKPGLLFKVSMNQPLVDGFPTPHPMYGEQIQDLSIPKAKPEAQIQISYETIEGQYADGSSYSLQKPVYKFAELNYGALGNDIQTSPRIAPAIAGLGLLEAIPEEDILAHQDINDTDNDGISGKANYVWDKASQSKQLGRFAWKAEQPSLLQQNAAAFAFDMGLTSRLFDKTDFTAAQEAIHPNIPNGGEPEVTDLILDRTTLYVSTLSVPAKRNTDKPQYTQGRKIFNELNCNSCHIQTHTTGTGNTVASLDNQRIEPFTDLLLHDMGEGLADNRPVFLANGKEWKTPPLWGIGLIPTVNDHSRLLHDGRARNIEEAILWHGGEAQKSQEAFKNLSQSERKALVFFLESI